MATPKIVADFETQLSTAIAVGGTSFSLASATDDDGVSLPTGLYYFTVDNGSTQKEYLAGTLSGNDVTGVVSVSRQGVETSGAVRAHRVGASVILTDFATYMRYMNAIALVSAPDASVSAKGVVEIATTEQIDDDEDTGESSAPVVVRPSELAASKYGAYLDAMTGVIQMFGGVTPPTGFLFCDGQTVSRATYAGLFAVIGTAYGAGDGSTTFSVPNLSGRFPLGYAASAPTKTLTFASRSSNTITVTGVDNHAHNELQTGQAVLYDTTSGVITGLTDNTTYYLIRVAYNQFQLASSVANANAGTAITLSGDGSGTQTFTITYTARPIAQTGGEETHALTDAEMPSHTHNTTGGSSTGGSTDVFDVNRDYNGNSPLVVDTSLSGSDAPHNNMPLFTVVNFIIKT